MHKIVLPKFSEKIFKAYDIRGKYPEEINENAAYKIARSFATYLKLSVRGEKLEVVMSSDDRLSSPALKKAFIEGLLDEGVNVIDAGIITTPMHYFVVNKTEAGGGAMITASHLPMEFNGIKLSKKEAVTIGGGFGMEEIENSALRGVFSNLGRGSVKEENFLSRYVDFFAERFSNLKQHHIKIKTHFKNSIVRLILPEILKRFSKFKISDISYDFGASFDFDGDRIFFSDEKRNEISGDIITALLIKRFNEEYPFKVVYDVRSSRVVKEEIEKYGGIAIESRVGHSFIKKAMRENNAVFSGEFSGHYYFKDFFFADSAIFAMFSVIDLLCKEKKPLSELIVPLKRYYTTPELNFEVSNRKDVLIDKTAAIFSNSKISYLDGIKIDYPDWWFILRPSNTEDLIRLRIEAITPELLEEKKKLVLENLNLK